MNPDLDRQDRRNPWPWPGDTPLQRARRIALAYRQHLRAANRGVADALDATARSYGETWVYEQTVTVDRDDMVTTAQAAELAGVGVETIRQWRKRGYISRAGRREHLQVRGLSPQGWPMFLAAEVLEAAAATRATRLSR